jgi:excinuclease UvrABC nuclease subunit
MKVKSTQPNIVAIHKGNPSYEIEFGSEPIELNEEIANHLVSTNPHFKIVDEIDVEIDLDYKSELEKIKGIGKKTARDIMTVFKNRQTLIEAIKRGDHLSFEEDTVKLLVKKYGGD